MLHSKHALLKIKRISQIMMKEPRKETMRFNVIRKRAMSSKNKYCIGEKETK